jgi:hypothetical protein
VFDIVYWSSVQFIDVMQQRKSRNLGYYPGSQSREGLGIVALDRPIHNKIEIKIFLTILTNFKEKNLLALSFVNSF